MSVSDKLVKARSLIEQSLNALIVSHSINFDYRQLKIILKDGIHIHIVYNNYYEYSYSILFSHLELDRCRFDNYDKTWDVSTKPHHLHPRNKKIAISSEMSGDPDKDIPLLCNLLKSGKLY